MTSGKREVHVSHLVCGECGGPVATMYSPHKINTRVVGVCSGCAGRIGDEEEYKKSLLESFKIMDEEDEIEKATERALSPAAQRQSEEEYERYEQNAIEDEGIKREIQENVAMAGYDQMEAEQEAEAIMETQEPDEGVEEDYNEDQAWANSYEQSRVAAGIDREEDFGQDPESLHYDDDPEAEEARREDEASAKSSERTEEEDY